MNEMKVFQAGLRRVLIAKSISSRQSLEGGFCCLSQAEGLINNKKRRGSGDRRTAKLIGQRGRFCFLETLPQWDQMTGRTKTGYSAGNPFEFNRDRLKISGCTDDGDEFRTAADNKKCS